MSSIMGYVILEAMMTMVPGTNVSGLSGKMSHGRIIHTGSIKYRIFKYFGSYANTMHGMDIVS